MVLTLVLANVSNVRYTLKYVVSNKLTQLDLVSINFLLLIRNCGIIDSFCFAVRNKMLFEIGNALPVVTLSQIDFRGLSYSSSMYTPLGSMAGAVFVKQR